MTIEEIRVRLAELRPRVLALGEKHTWAKTNLEYEIERHELTQNLLRLNIEATVLLAETLAAPAAPIPTHGRMEAARDHGL